VPVTTVVALVLACVFLVAAVAKSLDRAGTQRSLADFGVPRRLRAPLAVVLPLLELAVAIGLVVTQSTRVAAAVGGTMLAIFTGALAAALLRGRAPECGCFGRLQPGPAGPTTLARNGVLVAAALLVASQPAAPKSARELAAAALVLLVGGQALLSWTLLRRLGHALRRIESLEAELGAELDAQEPEIGSEAPAFVLPTADGAQVALADLLEPEVPLLLVFSDTGCGACSALMPDLARWQHEHADRLTLAVIGHGDAERLRAAAEEHGLEQLLVAPDRSVFGAYGSFGTPSAVLVGADGRLVSTVLYGADEIGTLLEPVDNVSSPKVAAYG
jgi:peroxiredoxin